MEIAIAPTLTVMSDHSSLGTDTIYEVRYQEKTGKEPVCTTYSFISASVAISIVGKRVDFEPLGVVSVGEVSVENEQGGS